MQGLTSGLSNSDAPFIGLQDFTQEGTFSWGNGMALGSYNNWLGGQPDNGATASVAGMGNQVIEALFFCYKSMIILSPALRGDEAE